MKFKQPLIKGRFKRRYKRFFADVELDSSTQDARQGQENPATEIVVAHCPNTGSMTNCLVEDSECWISKSDNPKRKLGYTLEAVTSRYGGMAGVNTGLTNKLVYEALQQGVVAELSGYNCIEKEVRFGNEKSRLDFCLSQVSDDSSKEKQNLCYVEVKNVTLGMPEGLGMFPDAVTSRGAKHLRELAQAIKEGHRAVLFFCVQHQGIDRVRPAKAIDPDYYQALEDAMRQGVEVLVYRVAMSPDAFTLSDSLPFSLDGQF